MLLGPAMTAGPEGSQADCSFLARWRIMLGAYGGWRRWRGAKEIVRQGGVGTEGGRVEVRGEVVESRWGWVYSCVLWRGEVVGSRWE